MSLAEQYWPIIRRLAADGNDIQTIQNYCLYKAKGSYLPSVQDIARVIKNHEDELIEAFTVQSKRETEKAEVRLFDSKVYAIRLVSNLARKKIMGINSAIPLDVPSASQQSFANLRARIKRRISHMQTAA